MKSHFVKKAIATTVLLGGTALAQSALALTFNEAAEINDPVGTGAGMTFPNFTLVAPGTHDLAGDTGISGPSAGNANDVDLFKFTIAAGSTFAAEITSSVQTSIDDYRTVMYLIDSNRYAWAFAWDPSEHDADSDGKMDLSVTLANGGDYFLAVSSYVNIPTIDVFNTPVDDWLGSQQIDHWSGFGSGQGTYGIQVTSVPEADTWAMLLAGLGLVGFSVKRRKQHAI
jgi:hypothetical protein